MLEKWCRKGNLRVDGKRVKSSTKLIENQILRIPPLPEIKGSKLSKPKYTLTRADRTLLQEIILYEDDFILALNKPFGLAVQGGTGTYRHVDGILKSFFASPESAHPHLVHRLDRDTTGILIVAKSLQAAQWLMKSFQNKTVKKIYWALAVGTPKPLKGTIDIPLKKKPSESLEKCFLIKKENLL